MREPPLSKTVAFAASLTRWNTYSGSAYIVAILLSYQGEYTMKPLALPWVFPSLVHGMRPTSSGRMWIREHCLPIHHPLSLEKVQMYIQYVESRMKHWQLYSKNRGCYTYQCSSPNSFWAVDDQRYTPLASRIASANVSRLADSSEVISWIASVRKLNSSMPAIVWCHTWEEDRVYSMIIECIYIHISQAYSYTCPYIPRFHICSTWNQEALQYGHYLLHTALVKRAESVATHAQYMDWFACRTHT